MYVPFTQNGRKLYAYFKNGQEYTRYVNCLEATLTYTTYFDQYTNTYYGIEFTLTKLSAMQMEMLSRILTPFIGEFFQLRDSNKFGVTIQDTTDPNIYHKFVASHNNHYKCQYCNVAHFKMTIYLYDFYMYDINMEHGDDCNGVVDANA